MNEMRRNKSCIKDSKAGIKKNNELLLMLIKGWLVIANLAQLGEAIRCLKIKPFMIVRADCFALLAMTDFLRHNYTNADTLKHSISTLD